MKGLKKFLTWYARFIVKKPGRYILTLFVPAFVLATIGVYIHPVGVPMCIGFLIGKTVLSWIGLIFSDYDDVRR